MTDEGVGGLRADPAVDGRIVAIARWQAGENVEAVARMLPELIAACRAEPGCVSFEALIPFEAVPPGDGEFVLIECYRDLDAFAAHRRSVHFRAIMQERIAPLLSGRTVKVYEA